MTGTTGCLWSAVEIDGQLLVMESGSRLPTFTGCLGRTSELSLYSDMKYWLHVIDKEIVGK